MRFTQYECYAVKRGDSWQKLFPDEDQRDIVMRINRMNTKLYPGLKIAVPTSFGSDPLDYSPFPQYIDPPGTKFIFSFIIKACLRCLRFKWYAPTLGTCFRRTELLRGCTARLPHACRKICYLPETGCRMCLQQVPSWQRRRTNALLHVLPSRIRVARFLYRAGLSR